MAALAPGGLFRRMHDAQQGGGQSAAPAVAPVAAPAAAAKPAAPVVDRANTVLTDFALASGGAPSTLKLKLGSG